MCGIYAHLKTGGNENSASICIEGLKKLEYRGYDSAGIAGVHQGKIISYKSIGKVNLLQKTIEQDQVGLNMAIAHTRWATHGCVTTENAHPQLDHNETIALVHNGIIENYLSLKNELSSKGIKFTSETDTEIITQLISHYYEGNLTQAVQKAIAKLEGAFAIALIHQDHPDRIIAAVRSCPLVIGICPTTSNIFISSDTTAFLGRPLDIFYLNDEEIAELTTSKIKIINAQGISINKPRKRLGLENTPISKEGYEHFLLKEINEQPKAITKALSGRIDMQNATALFEELTITDNELRQCNEIVILACGSAYHSGLIIASIFQKEAEITTRVEIASEFRYSDPLLTDKTLVIAVSQSGETADTLAAVKIAKKFNAKVIAFCNVENSSLTRESHCTLWLKAGPEISVCSTKAFTNQLIVLALFAIKLARLKTMSFKKGFTLLSHLQNIPQILSNVLSKSAEIKKYAEKYAHYEHFFFIGRQNMYPTSLEAALKLKEISYINATAYPAGELKHGPIALISPVVPTIALAGNMQTFPKLLSNLMEIKARNGPILVFAPEGNTQILSITDDVIFLPNILPDTLSSFLYAGATQLFAYHIAKIHNRDIDQPRNLAKSVTVE